MHRPNITVACLIHAQGHLLVVEEEVQGRVTLNQPAGHLEADETLLQAAQRELYEETGIEASMHYLLGIHQWIAPDNTSFIRFLFGADMPMQLPTSPQDSDIQACHWLTPEAILASKQLRSPLVAESVRLWLRGERYPLSLLTAFQWPFKES